MMDEAAQGLVAKSKSYKESTARVRSWVDPEVSNCTETVSLGGKQSDCPNWCPPSGNRRRGGVTCSPYLSSYV